MDNYNGEVVKCTSINNLFKIQKNWHPMPIINNINVYKILGLVVWRGELITID